MPMLPKLPLPAGDRWMEGDEISELLGVSRETVSRWVREKKLKGYKPGRKYFYMKSDVNRLLVKKGLPTI